MGAEAYLGDDAVEHVDEHEVEGGRGLLAEAHLEQVVVVWCDAETRQETVDHQVHVLTDAVRPS